MPAVAPTAVNDTATTTPRWPVVVDVLANDTPGNDGEVDPGPAVDTPLETAVVTLKETGQPEGVTVAAGGLSATHAAGTWTVVGQDIIFDPAVGFTGVAPAVVYVVTDALGESDEATVTVTVEAAVDLSEDRIKITDPTRQHTGSYRAVEVVLSGELDGAVDPVPLGLKRIYTAIVLVPLDGPVGAPILGPVPAGATVRFLGA